MKLKHPNIITVDIDQPDDFAIRIDKHGRISAWGEREAIDIGAVWTRIKFPLMPIRPHFAPGLEEVVRTEWTAFASGLVHIYEKERLSGAKVYRADSKMAQLVSAARAGFLVPESIVGVGKANAEHFSEEYQEMIFKPLHASRIAHSDDLHFDILATTSLNRADLQDIDEGEFRASPYFIQQRLDNSTEHRVIAFGDQVFCYKLVDRAGVAPLQDRRLMEPKFHLVESSRQLRSKISNYFDEIGVRYGTFDLLINEDDDIVFFECNPEGQWHSANNINVKNVMECFTDWVISKADERSPAA